MLSGFHGPTRSGRSNFRVALVKHITVLISTSIAGEGNEFFPRFVPEFHERWVSCALFLGHVIGCGPGRIRVGAPLDRSEIAFEFHPSICEGTSNAVCSHIRGNRNKSRKVQFTRQLQGCNCTFYLGKPVTLSHLPEQNSQGSSFLFAFGLRNDM